MDQNLQNIVDQINSINGLSEEDKRAAIVRLEELDKKIGVYAFKLDRSNDLKKTLTALLEETIEELEQKRKAVEEKNRDLEIEASLERVRVIALLMREPADMLEVCQSICAELVLLQVNDIRNVQTAIVYESKGIYINYEYYRLHDKTLITEVDYSHPVQTAFVNKMLCDPEGFYMTSFEGTELKEWFEYQKTTPQFVDTYLENATSLNYYWFSLGPVALGISTYTPLTDDGLQMFKRFRNVFGLAYRRYADLERALAQAKEAQIEASLERVRAVAMSMRQSDELINVCETLYKELSGLGFSNIRNAQIAINNDERQTYSAFEYAEYGQTIKEASYNTHKLLQEIEVEVKHSTEALFQKQITGHELDDWRAWRKRIGLLTDERLEQADAMCFYLYSIGMGMLGISTYDAITSDQLETLKRFKNVCELAYRRYADVAQAEAQAREAQIELGLERVRARAMAMQSSNELADLVTTLFDELTKLDFALSWCVINIIDGAALLNTVWIANLERDRAPESFKIPFADYPYPNAMLKAWKERSTKWVYDLQGKEKEIYTEFLLNETAAGRVPESVKASMRANKRNFVSFSFSNFGGLQTTSAEPLSEESLDILSRFGKVFDLTYTRFNDLKQAEEQAKESQIELALERVRARTMAMQHSDELAETAFILFQQFRELGENPDQATIGIINEAEGVIEYWVTLYGSQANHVFKFPVDEPNVTHKIYNAWKKHEKSLVIDLSGKALHDFSKFRQSMGGAGFNAEEKRRIINVAFFSKGLINVQSTVERSAESLHLLERFANVFESTYTRFLDLKNAEAQARESQIQLGLERVRAKAMAMQNTNELAHVINKVYDELTALDISFTRAIIWVFDPGEMSSKWWMASAEESGAPKGLYIKYHEYLPYISILAAWKRREEQWEYVLQDEDKKNWDNFLLTETELSGLPNEVKAGMAAPGKIILNLSFGSFGGLSASSIEPMTTANKEIIKRFAKAFDLTYTRFLDLKKAEAQAREAQIELALERVRAKTMAMQHSNELLETSQVVFQQLRDLGETADQIGIAIAKEDEGVFDLFATIYGTQMVRVVHPKLDDPFVMGRVYKSWKAHKKSFVVELGGEQLRQYNMVRNQLVGQNYYDENIGSDDRWIVSCASFSKGVLSFSSSTEPTREAAQLLERFAKVFEQTYTRFLDLQNAEAQTRESQIQLALERVRARTMAMQHSGELKEVVLALYEQLQQLDFDASACNIITNDQNLRAMQYWVSGFSQEIYPVSYSVPYLDHPYHEALLKPWLQGDQYSVIEYSGKAKKSFDKIFFTRTDFKNVPEAPKKAMIGIPSVTFSTAYVANVAVQALGPAPLSDENAAVLRRFAIVFEQTYTRFLDLKKAEAQAREAQIEAALERVRSRSMAMHQSTELGDVATVLFNELRRLGGNILTCGVALCDINDPIDEFWLCTELGVLPPLFVPHTVDDAHIGMYKGWENGADFYAIEKGGEDLKVHYDYMMTLNEVRPTFEHNFAAGASAAPNWQKWHAAYFKQGYIMVITLEPYNEEEVLKRFAKVFQQAYTRFLDLKQAEGHAKEAQVSLAMERIRSRAMAMHSSEELTGVANVLREQMGQLGQPDLETCAVHLYDVSADSFQSLYAFRPTYGSDQKTITRSTRFPKNSCEVISEMLAMYRSAATEYTISANGAKRDKWFEVLQNAAPEIMENVAANETIIPETTWFHFSDFHGGSLVTVSYQPPSEEIMVLQKRAASVFDMAYRRYRDLKQAEDQARESQIQLALERIRARTMAMQQSTELAETVSLVSQQLNDLGLSFSRVGFYIWKKDTRLVEGWTSNGTFEGLLPPLMLPYMEDDGHRGIYEAAQRGEHSYEQVLGGDELKRHYEWLLSQPSVWGTLSKTGDNAFVPMQIQYKYAGIFKQGYLMLMATEPQPAAGDLLERFALVFEQTYTRFLDLQRAESQAREARIEAALERTRTQSMMMQHSVELDDTLRVFHQQLLLLDIHSSFSFLWLPDEEKDRHIFWAAWAENDSKTFQSKAIDYALDREEPATAQCLIDWKGDEPVVSYHVPPEGVKNYFAAWQELIDGVEQLKPEYFQRGLYYVEAFMKYGCFGVMMENDLGVEDKKILGRFAIEFERTYTRFLDLQKAESQARESQIQLALERVRARTMAMHHSDELADASHLLERQVAALGIKTWGCAFHIFRENDSLEWFSNADGVVPTFELPRTHIWQRYYKACKRGEILYIEEYAGEACTAHYEFMAAMPIVGEALRNMKAAGLSFPTYQVDHAASFKYGYLLFITFEQVPEAHDIFKRFAKVFEQTYTRFLDLKQAEDQARESQIQLALERVRARTMAMQHSNELAEAASLLFKQVNEMGIETWAAGFNIWQPDGISCTAWMAHRDGTINPPFRTPHTEDPFFKKILAAKKRGEELFIFETEGEELAETFRYMLNLPVAKEVLGGLQAAGFQLPTFQANHCAFFLQGYLLFITQERRPEAHDIFKRFGKVFEQTYTRFLDLQKAEAQAREANIEAALEKVRSRSLAMHKSDELRDVVKVVFERLQELSFGIDGAAFIVTPGDITKEVNIWIGDDHAEYPSCFRTPFFDAPVITDILDAIDSGQDFFSKTYAVNEKNPWFEYAFKHTDYKYLPEELRSWIMAQENLTQCFALAKNSGVGIHFHNRRPLSENEIDILKRFSKVFEQSYIRFLDLQRAEIQARESQIEAALERVRSRTMGMQKSGELAEVIQLIYEQLVGLNFNINNANFVTEFPASGDLNIWMASTTGTYPAMIIVPYFDHPIFNMAMAALDSGADHFVTKLTFTEKNQWLDHYFKTASPLPDIPRELLDRLYNAPGYYTYGVIFKTVVLSITNYEGYAYTEAEQAVILRFGKVFEQTYTRFLDLQKAEAQVLEAQIEAALERVRSRTMGMQKSEELREVIQVVYEQLDQLNFKIDVATFVLNYKESDDSALWVAGPGVRYATQMFLPLIDNPIVHRLNEEKANGPGFSVETFTFEEKNSYFNEFFEHNPNIPEERRKLILNGAGLAWSTVFMNDIALSIQNYSGIPYSDNENANIKRFGKVFEQTYTRFLDLQKAEAQAREAVKQASLDRVRGEIASMRTTKDLERIIPLVWSELTILGIPFIRCGVFIVDEAAQLIHTHLSTPDGKAIAAFDLPFDADGIGRDVLPAWRKKQMAAIHWSATEFAANTKNLVSQGAIKSRGKYVTERPDTTLDLHFFPFLQGMLYVGNIEPLNVDAKDLVQSLAEAFSTAYARYEDFNKLEVAKQQVDKTLIDLKSAQTQLIQNEKMASLGELTAGIAHEIQNPLNFVNNFSEVNAELIEEMKKEIENGDLDEILALALDIEQNSKKINMHGKRADGIVKGMLQHSKSGSTARELTQINALADEYMRLAYHGLRAKDKAFNVEMVTHFDPELPKIMAIGQDIGRVMLNLFNNAFYAVSKKQKTAESAYEPEVSVTTYTEKDQVVIKVRDNGIGIPDNIKEKIMQPFFTTKPTGEGTGLGLSLTYDMVVKGHGGTIEVNTREGEFTEFIIQLPLNQ